jgi:hypothetical protein
VIALITEAKTDEVQPGWLESREKGETVLDSPDDHPPISDPPRSEANAFPQRLASGTRRMVI